MRWWSSEWIWGWVLVLWFLAALSAGQDPPAAEPSLAAGVQQVQDGDFESAVLTLDAVVRNLASRPDLEKDLARACLHLGVAYLQLGQAALARSRFQQALQHDASLELRSDEFPPKVLRAFEEARTRFREHRTLERRARRKRGKGAVMVAGAGAAAAGGVALAITRERENTPPSAEILVTPEGVALAVVTALGFTARGSDAEGDAVRYEWAFGDGNAAVGATVSHVYDRPGVFTVRLTASDGLATSEVRRDITVGALSGRWRLGEGTIEGVTYMMLNQGGGQHHFAGCLEPAGACGCYGVASDPRSTPFNCHLDHAGLGGGWTCILMFRGEADPNLRTITGSLSCRDGEPFRCGRCQGDQPFTLTRE